MGKEKLMADINEFEVIKENFEYITEAIDSMRAQNAMNAGNLDRMLTNINGQLEGLSVEENTDLIKVFLSELKRSLDERHTFVSSKFSEIETSFNDLVQRADAQLKGSEIKELFEIIATNLNTFNVDFSAQKDLISEIGLQIEELKQDDSAEKEILKNISTLKNEIEKYGNGFESIILNLNDNFKKVAETFSDLDPTESLGDIKKDIENIFMSSNAVLSALQVIDRKNREFEEVINHLVTKEDFKLEQNQVASLIAQNIEITNILKSVPTDQNLVDLAERVDTTVGVINALKNMLSETGEQNQKILTAQLDNLEKKILNISTEEEFIGFRKELSEFSKEVIQSTNLMRSDLADTNSELKSLLSYLSAMDIKNSFENFAGLTKVSENNVKESVSKISSEIKKEIAKNQETTKGDIEESVLKVQESLDVAKQEITESSKNNLSSILEHIQSVVNNIFSIKNSMHIENMENIEALDSKFQDLKDDFTNSSNFIVQNSQENLESVLTNVEKIFQEVSTVKEGIEDASSSQTKTIENSMDSVAQKVEEIKSDLNQNSQESFANILTVVEDFSGQINTVRVALERSTGENLGELKEIIGGLSLKIMAFQENLTKDYDINFADVKGLIEELKIMTQSAKESLEQTSGARFANIKTDIEKLDSELKNIQEDFDLKSKTNLAKIVSLFENLTVEFESHRDFMSEAAQVNFEKVNSSIQNLNQKIDETQVIFNEDLKTNFEDIKTSISSLPGTIKESQLAIEAQQNTLIEENSRSIEEVGEKIQSLIKGLVAKENPFKGEVLYEFAQLKLFLESVKDDLSQSNEVLGENVGSQISKVIESIEGSISQYDEKHDLALLSLQNKIVDYFENIQNASQESELKLENSIREIQGIKPELNSIIESLTELKSDTGLAELSAQVNKKVDGILINITQFEEIASAKHRDALQSIIETLAENFENVSDSLKNYQNFTSVEVKSFADDLVDKVEALRTQIGLISTDVVDAVTMKSNKMLQGVESLSEEISKISSIDFETIIGNIKTQVEESYASITDVIKENISEENEKNLEKILQDFESLKTSLNEVIVKGTSGQLEEINSLKETLDLLTQRIEKVSSGVKEATVELNVIQDKLSEVQNEAKTEIIEKIVQVNDETKQAFLSDLEEKVANIKENYYLSTQSLISRTMEASNEDVFEKLDNFREKMLDAHDDSRANILAKILETQSDSKAAILEELKEHITFIKENISSFNLDERFIEEFSQKIKNLQTTFQLVSEELDQISITQENHHLSTQSLVSQTMDASNEKVIQRLDDVEGKLLDSQDDLRADLIDKILEVHHDTKGELADKIMQAQDGNKESILDEISQLQDDAKAELAEKIDEVKTEILSKVVTSQEEAKSDFLTEIQESLALIKENFHLATQSSIAKTMDSANEYVFDKIEALQDKLFGLNEEIKALISQNLAESNSDIKDEIIETICQSQDDAKISLVEKIIEVQKAAKEDIVDEIIHAQDSAKDAVIEKLLDAQEKLKEEFIEDIAHLQGSAKDHVTERVLESQENIKLAIVEEVQESIGIIKKELAAIDFDDNLTAGLASKIDSLSESLLEAAEDIQDKVSNIGTNYTKSAQALLSEVKTSFYEKVEDSFDDLKSFIEVIEDKNDIQKITDDLKYDIFDKFSELTYNIEESISSVNVKKDLNELSEEIETSINTMFKDLEDKFASCIDNNKSITELSEKTEEINRRIEDLKKAVSEDISEKFDKFELNIDNQRKDFEDSAQEIKNALAELKESYLDLSLNSNMEIATSLMEIQEKIDVLQSKFSGLDFDKKFDVIENKFNDFNLSQKIGELSDKIDEINIDKQVSSIESKLDDLDYGKKFSELSEKLDDLDISKIIESSKSQIAKEFEVINQKLDLFALESGNNPEANENIDEIKKIVQSQSRIIEQINNSMDIDSAASIQEDIKKALKDFEQKLGDLEFEATPGTDTSSFKKELSTFKGELFENLINLFSQISFVVEAEEIKDFVDEKTEEIKAEINAKLKNIGTSGVVANIEFETGEIKEFIKEETEEIKKQLKKLQFELEEENFDEYSYTLQDVESDIAKVRMVLNDIIKSKGDGKFEQQSEEFEKLNESLLSISTRTNKLLLNSDESYNVLKENLHDFRDIVFHLEERMKHLDNTETIDKIEKQLNNVNNMMISSAKSDKVFNQSFMFLAEWVDTASENIENILEKSNEIDTIKLAVSDLKKSMPKKSDIEVVANEISAKFEKQQNKITLLEQKIETILEKFVTEEGEAGLRPDAKLNKKVDNIEKQLTKLNKSIEKLTSYIDEE